MHQQAIHIVSAAIAYLTPISQQLRTENKTGRRKTAVKTPVNIIFAVFKIFHLGNRRLNTRSTVSSAFVSFLFVRNYSVGSTCCLLCPLIFFSPGTEGDLTIEQKVMSGCVRVHGFRSIKISGRREVKSKYITYACDKEKKIDGRRYLSCQGRTDDTERAFTECSDPTTCGSFVFIFFFFLCLEYIYTCKTNINGTCMVFVCSEFVGLTKHRLCLIYIFDGRN